MLGQLLTQIVKPEAAPLWEQWQPKLDEQGQPILSQDQRDFFLKYLKSNPTHSVLNPISYVDPKTISNSDLWNAYVTTGEHAINPRDDTWQQVASLGGSALAGAGLGTLFSGAAGAGATSGMSAADASTLGTMTEGGASAGAGATGGTSGAAASGGGMWDWLDEFSSLGDAADTGTYGASGTESAGAPTGLAGDQALDIFGSTPDMPGWGNDASTWDPQYSQPGGGSSLWGKIADWAKGALPGARSLLGGGSAAAGGSAPGGMGFGTAAFDSAPFLLSLGLANKQRNDINPYLDRLNSLYDRFSSNEGGYLKSVTDPYDMATAQQHGALTSSLGNRGLMGSSFGDMSLDNQNYMRDVGRGDLLSRGINESVGAQSQLTDQAMKGINTRNAASNALLGAGLNASARLFSPQQDPFGLRALMGGY